MAVTTGKNNDDEFDADQVTERLRQLWDDAARMGKTLPPRSSLMHKILEHLGPIVPSFLVSFRAELTSESDRGCVVLAAAYLDDKLAALIGESLVDRPALVREMLEDRGPLAAFSARIDMAYLLGLIPNETRTVLHRIRKIRNIFAHEGDASFDHPEVARAIEGLPPDPFNRPGARRRFVFHVCASLVPIFGAWSRRSHIAEVQLRPVPQSVVDAIPKDVEQLLTMYLGMREAPDDVGAGTAGTAPGVATDLDE